MRYILLSLCFGLITTIMNAQLDPFSSPSGFGNSYKPRTKSEEKKVVGSPYLNEEFLKSEIQVRDGTVYRDVMLRYNIMSDEIEFLKSNGVVRAMNSRDMTRWAVIGKDTIVTRLFEVSGNMEHRHFILLESGPLQLLLRKRKHFREATGPQGYQSGTDPAYVDSGDELYLCFSEENIALRIPRKKEVESFFGEEGALMADFVKAGKLSLKKEEDLLKMIRFYNSGKK